MIRTFGAAMLALLLYQMSGCSADKSEHISPLLLDQNAKQVSIPRQSRGLYG
jgi:hypothetical protein